MACLCAGGVATGERKAPSQSVNTSTVIAVSGHK